MRVISREDKETWVKMYLENPDLSLKAIADQADCSSSGLHNWVQEFQTNDGVIGEAQIGGYRWSKGLEAIHCELCQLIFQHGHTVSNPILAQAINELYSIDVSAEVVRQYRIKYNLPYNRKDKGKKGGDWAKITEVIDDNGQIRPLARARVESELLLHLPEVRGKKHYPSAIRRTVVYKIKNGMSVKEASETFDVNIKIIYKWLKLYDTEGRLTRKKRAKNRVFFDLADYPVLAMARSYPELSCNALKLWLLQNHQLKCSVQQIKDHLTKHHVNRPIGTKKSAEKLFASVTPDHYTLTTFAELESQADAESSSLVARLKRSEDGLPWRLKFKLMKETTNYWQTFRVHFAGMKDPRQGPARSGPMITLLFLILLSAMVFAGSAANVVRFATTKRLKWLRPILAEESIDKVPRNGTFQRLMQELDSEDFGLRAIQFTLCRREQLGLPMTGLTFAWDMKTSRGSKDGPDSDYLHTASMMEHQSRDTLAVFPTGRLYKEVNTLVKTVKTGSIPVKGNMITADALYGKAVVANAIVEQGGDYFLAVRGNQAMVEDCHLLEDMLHGNYDSYCQQQDDKRPNTTRTCYVFAVNEWVKHRQRNWKNFQTVIFYKVEDPTRPKKRKKPKKANQEPTKMDSYRIFVSSRRLTAEEAIATIRNHWGIEENHQILDVDMREDAHQARKGNAALNWAIIKRLVLNELMRSRTKEPISGAMTYSQGCIWNLLAQLTQFHLKYPKYAKYFDFQM